MKNKNCVRNWSQPFIRNMHGSNIELSSPHLIHMALPSSTNIITEKGIEEEGDR